MFRLFRKRSDRSYHIKLKRGDYAKLSLLADRLGKSESNTMAGCIDFAIAHRGTGGESPLVGVDLASLVGGGEGDPDLLTGLAKAFGPQIIKQFLGTAPNAPTNGSVPPTQTLEGKDVSKALKDLGL